MPDALFDRLASFRIDPPGVALPFARRLAHENGWSRAFAERAVAEYRRFVWLAMRAGHPVTPSPAVDEVWHLHLCYTRSYWDELCGRVLGRPLHHGPTLGGAAESAKYADWYARTLASYRQHFGEPPSDLWPAPAERFRSGIPRKVDARSHWIVSKARVRALLGGGTRAAALALVLMLTAGCVDASVADSVVLFGLLVVFAVFLVCFVVLAVRVRAAARSSANVPRKKRGGEDPDCGSEVGCGYASTGGRHHGLHGAGAGATGIPPAVPDRDGHGGHGKGGHGHGAPGQRGHAHGHDDRDGRAEGTGHGHEESGSDSGGSAGDSGGGGGGDSGGSSGCGGGGCGGGGGGGD